MLKNKEQLPFSKKIIVASRCESYLVAIFLFIFAWFDKDVSSIAILASLAWGGYATAKSFYLWMAKHEHIMDKKIEYQKLNIDTENLDCELNNLETQEIENNNIY